MKVRTVPTGHICVFEGEKGRPLECLSIGDYGKEKNLKADFLGLREEINGVPHGELVPLEEKWVITISSQYGCSMGCVFCDVPKVGQGINATFADLKMQVSIGLGLHPEVKTTRRLNLHYARMGEPSYNPYVIDHAIYTAGFFQARGWGFHPVVSTMMPRRNAHLIGFIRRWLHTKNVILRGNAGLQISVNTTDEDERYKAFNGSALSLEAIARLVGKIGVVGRKITLNFALTDAPIDAQALRNLFDPDRFLCKITPMHLTTSCKNHGIATPNGYASYQSYRDVEESLKSAGFDVIVFVPSLEEDESKITCGNAILAETEATE